MIARALTMILVAMALLLAGCTERSASTIEQQATMTSESVVVVGSATLGWIAGAGAPHFLADAVVGVRTSDACPQASFYVPDGARSLTISATPGSGVGPYNVAVSNREEITFKEYLTPDAFLLERDEAVPGIWSIEFLPEGATALQAWDVHVSYSIMTPFEPEIALLQDGKCLP